MAIVNAVIPRGIQHSEHVHTKAISLLLFSIEVIVTGKRMSLNHTVTEKRKSEHATETEKFSIKMSPC